VPSEFRLLVNGAKHDGNLPQNVRELKTSGNSFQQHLKALTVCLFKGLRTNHFKVRLDARQQLNELRIGVDGPSNFPPTNRSPKRLEANAKVLKIDGRPQPPQGMLIHVQDHLNRIGVVSRNANEPVGEKIGCVLTPGLELASKLNFFNAIHAERPRRIILH
jgi:hypothetical protein